MPEAAPAEAETGTETAAEAGTRTAGPEALFSANLAEAQAESAAMFARANELMVKTARAIWESQADLLRLEIEQTAKNFVPPRPGQDAAAAFSAQWDQWHEGMDRAIAHMRRVNDAVRDYGWQLFGLYSEGFRQIEKEFKAASRPH